MREGGWSASLNLAKCLRPASSAVIRLASINAATGAARSSDITKCTGREQVFMATKVFFIKHDGPDFIGLSSPWTSSAL